MPSRKKQSDIEADRISELLLAELESDDDPPRNKSTPPPPPCRSPSHPNGSPVTQTPVVTRKRPASESTDHQPIKRIITDPVVRQVTMNDNNIICVSADSSTFCYSLAPFSISCYSTSSFTLSVIVFDAFTKPLQYAFKSPKCASGLQSVDSGAIQRAQQEDRRLFW